MLGLGQPATALALFAEREELLARLERGHALTAEQTAELYRQHASEALGPPLLDPLRRV